MTITDLYFSKEVDCHFNILYTYYNNIAIISARKLIANLTI